MLIVCHVHVSSHLKSIENYPIDDTISMTISTHSETIVFRKKQIIRYISTKNVTNIQLMITRRLRSNSEKGKKSTKNVTQIQFMMTLCLRSNSEKGKRKIHKKCHKNPVDDDPVPEVQLSSWGLEHHLAATCTHKTRFAIMSKRIYEKLKT